MCANVPSTALQGIFVHTVGDHFTNHVHATIPEGSFRRWVVLQG